MQKKSENSNENTKKQIIIDTASGIHLCHEKDWMEDFHEVYLNTSYSGCGENIPIHITGEGYLRIKVSPVHIPRVHSYYSASEDATIISADRLLEETSLELTKGYHQLRNNYVKYPTEKIGKTIWIDTNFLIDVDDGNYVVRLYLKCLLPYQKIK